MVADAINLDEVVAIGYGIAKKSDLTGAVASIKSENLTNSKVGTVTTALQGLAAGVQVTTGSVKPGGDASVVIRGVGSLRAGSEPLYIVDGIPVQGGLQDLSSGDIESIEILKDASSASIYGSRGSNGVVLVTTKKGTSGKAKISLNASFGTQRMLNKQDLMNAQQYYELVSIAQPNYKWTSEELRLLSRGESTDWQDAVTQNGQYQNYNFSISGGKNDIQHFLGVDWYDQKGTVMGQRYQRFSTRSQLDYYVSDRMVFGSEFQFTYSDNDRNYENLLDIALKRWTPENPTNDYPKIRLNGTNYGMTDFWLHDASYLKINNISLTYQLPAKWLRRTGFVDRAELFGSITNVYTFTSYPGPNPESFNRADKIAGAAVDYTAYPQTRTYNIGIKLSVK